MHPSCRSHSDFMLIRLSSFTSMIRGLMLSTSYLSGRKLQMHSKYCRITGVRLMCSSILSNSGSIRMLQSVPPSTSGKATSISSSGARR